MTSSDHSLIDVVREATVGFAAVQECLRDVADGVVEHVKQRCLIRKPSHWWWSSIGVEHHVYDYGESDVTALIERLVPKSDEPAFLLVSDGRSPPWPVFRGTAPELLSLVRRVDQYFEYIITSYNYEWVAFDNPDDNVMLTVGLAKRAIA